MIQLWAMMCCEETFADNSTTLDEIRHFRLSRRCVGKEKGRKGSVDLNI